MSNKLVKRPRAGARSRRWRRALLLAGAALPALIGGAVWLRPVSEPAATGTPRVVLDRTEIDLGYLAFETPVRATFTITNGGDGPLRIAGSPRVLVAAGC